MAQYKLGTLSSETTLSMHNRHVSMSWQFIGKDSRIGDGSLVRDHVATKRMWTLEWDKLPHSDANTVDGEAGLLTLRTLIAAGMTTAQSFLVPNESGGTDSYTVMVRPNSYQEQVVSRVGSNWKHNVKFELVEV